MKYAVYQMDLIVGNPQENREKVSSWINETMEKEKPDVLVLPEMWNTGFTLAELDKLADEDNEPTQSLLQKLAKQHHVNIVGGSIANKKEGKIYNTSLVINREGAVVHRYDKIHLVPMLNEHKYLTGGTNQIETFELEGIKMGVIICYDLRFPELARKLALEGAQILHVVAEWPLVRKNHWKYLQLARAIENQMFIVSSNITGSNDTETFAGTSMIIDPWGDVIKVGSEVKEETIIATLDLDAVPKIRESVPVFSSRVPKLY